MSQRLQETVERFTTFNNAVIAFVENCSAENWQKKCSHEKWSVGVVAGGDLSVHQIIKYIILRSGTEHLASMKSAVGE